MGSGIVVGQKIHFDEGAKLASQTKINLFEFLDEDLIETDGSSIACIDKEA